MFDVLIIAVILLKISVDRQYVETNTRRQIHLNIRNISIVQPYSPKK